jgi:hypothetical protein
MRQLVAAAVLLFVAASVAAGQAPGDYKVGLLREPVWPMLGIGSRVQFYAWAHTEGERGTAVIELDVPSDTIEPGRNCSGTRPVRCMVGPDEQAYLWAVLNQAGTFTATARVIAPDDPNPANDTTSLTYRVVDQPQLTISVAGGLHRPGTVSETGIHVLNFGATTTDVVVTVSLAAGATFTGKVLPQSAANCTFTPTTAVCAATAPLGHREGLPLRFEVLLPDFLDGRDLPIHATVRSSAADLDPSDDSASGVLSLIPQYLVSNTHDAGAGSLRQALLDAQHCAKSVCAIRFNIAGTPHGGRFIIQPLSELPPVRGPITIDGSTQTRFSGDSDPHGPELVLDGSLAPVPTRGLVVTSHSCSTLVTELAIENFSAPGIEFEGDLGDLWRCGLSGWARPLITRNHLRGNLRGIALTNAARVDVVDNVIADNQRAGIFADNIAFVAIARNRITGNGASGIFVNPGNFSQLRTGVISENVISGNGEWGIARGPHGDVEIQRNSIFGNRFLGIDYGLDFETPNRADDRASEPGVPNKPVILSARYDPATNKTNVRVRLDSASGSVSWAYTIDLYASSGLSAWGHPEAERWVGFHTFRQPAVHEEVTIAVEGDLRGKFITGTNTRLHVVYWEDYVTDTSELSNAVRVE